MSREALIVGISTYQNLPPLKTPASDAEAIATQLETYGDFRVTRLPEIVQSEKLKVGVKTPVSLAELEAALVKLFKPKGHNIPQTALFYFSGHGLQKEAGICEGYLATSETNPSHYFYGLSLFWLRRLLLESPVRQRIVLLDCCHSGEILNFLEADPGAKSGTDRLFMAASREYESAYESLNGEYSVFTQALLDGLDPRRLPTGHVTNYALTDWVSNALKGETQQPLFENSGSEIILTRCQNSVTLLQSTISQDVCPYRGLEPFEEKHADYFFGREHLTDQLLNKLRSNNFLAVIGASGSGKSSLVRAGLVHKLQRGHTLSGSDRWQIRVITPTEQPFKSLANAFVNSSALAIDRAEQLRRAETLLQESGSGLTHLIRASLLPETKNSRLVLVIDQFEEIFTLCQGPHAEHDRQRFFNGLLFALEELGERFNLVIVLRADFFSKCSLYNSLAEKIEHNLVMVTPLSYDQIKASILKPADKVGLVCEPNLVYNILLDIVGAPGELPLLQYTLLELWQRRQQDREDGPARLTLNAYVELGGVRGTLQKRADETFYSLTPEEQQVAKRIFIALTQLGEGNEDTRRRVLKSELVSPHISSELVERVLEKLVIAKLVVTNQVATSNERQEKIDQRFANVSSALRLAQVVRQNSSKMATTAETACLSSAMPETLAQQYNLNVTRLAQTGDLTSTQTLWSEPNQETVDIAHETLIRHWSLLRSWLDENREMLRRQRRIERAAREWDIAHQPRMPEYLLRGSRLLDAEDFFTYFPDELSALAQQYIAISREENSRTQRELRILRIAIPCTLVMALGITISQYRIAAQNQAEKDYQLQVATSRQWSAIAQSILQESSHDPTPALLISRMAAEHGRTSEAESSLRAALQQLRLQTSFQIDQQSIQQLALSPTQDWAAALLPNGQIHLWSVTDPNLRRSLQIPNPPKPPQNTTGAGVNPQSANAIAFSADGKFLVVSPEQSTQVYIWSVETGELKHQLGGFEGTLTSVAISPDHTLVAATQGKSVKVWQINTGQLRAQWSAQAPINSLWFNPNGTQLLTISGATATLWQIANARPMVRFSHAVPASSAAFRPDQQVVAIADQSGTIWLWNHLTGKLQQRITPLNNAASTSGNFKAYRVLFSPNGQQVILLGADGYVGSVHLESGRQWQAKPSAMKLNPTTPAQPTVGAFSPDSQQLVIAKNQPSQAETSPIATIYDADTGQELDTLRGHTAPINAIQFSQEGELIITASADGSVRLWNANVGSELPSIKLPNQPIEWVAFHQKPFTPERDATITSDLNLNPGSTQAIANPPTATALTRPSTGLSSTEGLLTIDNRGLMKHWKFVTYPATTNPVEQSPTNQDQTSAQNNLLLPGQKIFGILRQMGKRILLFGTDQDRLNANAISGGAIQHLTHLGARPLEVATLIQSTATTTNLMAGSSPNTRLTAVASSLDGQLFAIANNLGAVELWQMQSDRSVKQLHRLQDSPERSRQEINGGQPSISSTSVSYLVFSPNGEKLAGVGVDKTIRVWEVSSGKLLNELSGHEALVEMAEFSANGRQLVSASWDRTARIWDVNSGSLVTTLPHPDTVTSAHFNPDGHRVITTSLDKTARVLDVSTSKLQVILAGHRGAVLDGQFSPDGKNVVTASADGTARLWDANTGIERAILRSTNADRQEAIRRAFFSPDGQYVATLSTNGTLDMWMASWEGLLALARDRSLRQLKPEECLRYLRVAPNMCPSLTLKSSTPENDTN